MAAHPLRTPAGEIVHEGLQSLEYQGDDLVFVKQRAVQLASYRWGLRDAMCELVLDEMKGRVVQRESIEWFCEALSFWVSDGGGHAIPWGRGLLYSWHELLKQNEMPVQAMLAAWHEPVSILWLDEAFRDPEWIKWRARCDDPDEAFIAFNAENDVAGYMDRPSHAPVLQARIAESAAMLRHICSPCADEPQLHE